MALSSPTWLVHHATPPVTVIVRRAPDPQYVGSRPPLNGTNAVSVVLSGRRCPADATPQSPPGDFSPPLGCKGSHPRVQKKIATILPSFGFRPRRYRPFFGAKPYMIGLRRRRGTLLALRRR
eukprot:gene3212-biopygen3673